MSREGRSKKRGRYAHGETAIQFPYAEAGAEKFASQQGLRGRTGRLKAEGNAKAQAQDCHPADSDQAKSERHLDSFQRKHQTPPSPHRSISRAALAFASRSLRRAERRMLAGDGLPHEMKAGSFINNPPLSHQYWRQMLFAEPRQIYEFYTHERGKFKNVLTNTETRLCVQRPLGSPASQSVAG